MWLKKKFVFCKDVQIIHSADILLPLHCFGWYQWRRCIVGGGGGVDSGYQNLVWLNKDSFTGTRYLRQALHECMNKFLMELPLKARRRSSELPQESLDGLLWASQSSHSQWSISALCRSGLSTTNASSKRDKKKSCLLLPPRPSLWFLEFPKYSLSQAPFVTNDYYIRCGQGLSL